MGRVAFTPSVNSLSNVICSTDMGNIGWDGGTTDSSEEPSTRLTDHDVLDLLVEVNQKNESEFS
ncbi:hypothetical protein HanLR1_Chr17g0678531 [Helianthus annuus]|nr:hypothetical protein HanLR1_Chr17g0678531 [Helianthus annuus]